MAKVNLRAYNREIETMIDRGHLDEAIAHCQHILKTFPKHLETYRLLGKVYLEYKRYKEAVDIFSRVLVADPNDFVAHVGMSIIRDDENKLDDAIWHMERAFETQPSNAAIQSELQRLYGRRDGVPPPRIRMTRGALAHMYVQGELYPQAISEIKSVLKEDPGRSDMEALLARAYYRSGQKNEAADAASKVLRRYPYCIDANRVLAEIFGTEHPENAQAYRQRVVELDPYAAQVTGTTFQSNEVLDAAVSLEHLDWNGRPVGAGAQAEWAETQAISLESGNVPGEQPDWLMNAYADTTPPSPSKTKPVADPDAFASPTPSSFSPPSKQAEPAEDIPDFLREAGWGNSTGAFDESKPVFDSEAPTEQTIAQGELPDWVKAMAPPEATQPEEEEELPDWINKIGTGELHVPSVPESSEQSDLMSQLGQAEAPAESQSPDEQLDWMSQVGQPAQAAPQSSEEQPDWMSQLEQPAQPAPQSSNEEADWMSQLEQPAQAMPQSSDEGPDWLKQFDQPGSPTGTPAEETRPDWLSQFGAGLESAPSEQPSNDFDFLNPSPAEQPPQEMPLGPAPSKVDTGSLGTSEQERDDSFAWLEALAAKQGASEGLLTRPEDRLEQEPDWIKQAKNLSATDNVPQPSMQQPPEMQQPPTPPQAPAAQPYSDLEELGKSEQEQDDSFAWLESLAAKQGASEGLLTKPEERSADESDWIKQAKEFSGQTPTPPPTPQPSVSLEEPPLAQPSANLEELGKSEQEQDDSFAWLESLAAKQGASEGLLTKPEDRLEQEPEWVKQAKDVSENLPPVQPVETPPPATDATGIWLKSLVEEESKPTPASMNDETAMWLKSLDEAEMPPTSQKSEAETDMPAWMQNIEEEKASESAFPEKERSEESAWMGSVEEPVPPAAPKSEADEIPTWLSGLDQGEEQITSSAGQEDLPAWLRDETGEVVAEPTKIEPTRATDWQPVEEKQAEPPPMPEPTRIIYSPPLDEEQPEPPAPPPPVVEEPRPEPKPKTVKKAAPKLEPMPAAPEPYKEPVTRRGTGMLTMPVDPILGSARNELSRSNIPGALEKYGKLIKKARFLDEVIHDLREALYRFPVEVSIWQSLGDAYMRANRLQDALDSYTKAEELLR